MIPNTPIQRLGNPEDEPVRLGGADDAPARLGSSEDTLMMRVIPSYEPEPITPKTRTFGTAIKENLTSPRRIAGNLPGVGAVTDIGEGLQIQEAVKRLNTIPGNYEVIEKTGEMSTGLVPWPPQTFKHTRASDQKFVDEFIQEQTAQSSLPAQAVDITAAIPGYAAEFAATGGMGTAVREGVVKVGTKVAISKMKGGIARTIAKRLVNVAGWAAAGTVQGTLMPQRTLATLAQNEASQAVGLSEESDFTTNLLRSYVDTVIQAGTERAGADLFKIPGAGKMISNTLNKLPFAGKVMPKIAEAWAKATGNPVSAFMGRIAQKGGFDGVLEEMGEERLATVLSAVINDQDFGASQKLGREANWKERLEEGLSQDFERLPAEFAAFAVIPGGQAAVGAIANRVASKPGQVSPMEPMTQESAPTIPLTPDQAKAAVRNSVDDNIRNALAVGQMGADVTRQASQVEDATKTVKGRYGQQVNNILSNLKESLKDTPQGEMLKNLQETGEAPEVITEQYTEDAFQKAMARKQAKDLAALKGEEVSPAGSFIPSSEWQEVSKDTPVPPGGEYQLDFESKKTYVRWPNLAQEQAEVSPEQTASEPSGAVGQQAGPVFTPEVKAILADKNRKFTEKSAAIKDLLTQGKITEKEFGKALIAIPSDVQAKSGKGGKQVPALQKIVDDYDNQANGIESVGDVVDAVRDMENVPDAVKKAIFDYDQAIKSDKGEYGKRSGLVEEAEDAVMAVISTPQTPAATGQGESIPEISSPSSEAGSAKAGLALSKATTEKGPDDLETAVQKYGWSVKRNQKGTIYLHNRDNRPVVRVDIKGNKYKFSDLTDNKLMDGRGSVGKGAEKLLKEFYFAKEDAPAAKEPWDIVETPAEKERRVAENKKAADAILKEKADKLASEPVEIQQARKMYKELTSELYGWGASRRSAEENNRIKSELAVESKKIAVYEANRDLPALQQQLKEVNASIAKENKKTDNEVRFSNAEDKQRLENKIQNHLEVLGLSSVDTLAADKAAALAAVREPVSIEPVSEQERNPELRVINREGEKAPKKTEEKTPDKPVDPKKYYSYEVIDPDAGTNGFVEVKGRKIIIPGFEKLDIFVTKNKDGFFSMTEGRSGLSMGKGKTQKAAFDKAKGNLDAVKAGKVTSKKTGKPATIEDILAEGITKAGLSPRYGGKAAVQEGAKAVEKPATEKKSAVEHLKDMAEEEIDAEPTPAEQLQGAKEEAAGLSQIDFVNQVEVKGNKVIYGNDGTDDIVLHTYRPGYYPTNADLETLHSVLKERVRSDAAAKGDKTGDLFGQAPAEPKEKTQAAEEGYTEFNGKVRPEEWYQNRWDSAKAGIRVKYALDAGNYLGKREDRRLSQRGEKLAETKWADVSEGHKASLRRLINKDYGVVLPTSSSVSENTLITADMKDAAVARQESRKTARKSKGKHQGTAAIFTPDDVADAAIILGYYTERGVRTLAAFTEKAIEVYGEPIRPYLGEVWKEVKATLKITDPPEPPTPNRPKSNEPTPPTGPTKRTVVPPAEGGTSLQNSAVAETRREIGLPPLREADPYKDEEVLQHARDILSKDPRRTERLLDDLRGHIRLISVDEEALLLHRMVQLENERDVLASQKMAAMKSGSAEDQAIINNAIISTMEAYQELTDITKAVGRDIARALRFRQRFVDNTYTLLKMEYQISAAVGRALNPAELQRIADLQDQLSKANAELKAALTAEEETKRRLAEVEAQKFLAEERAKKAEADRRSKPSSGPRSPQKKTEGFGKSNKLVTYERHVQNRERFKAIVSGELRSGLDPRLMEIAIEEGVYFLEAMTRVAGRKAVEYADWAAKMTAELGDGIIPLLKDAWDGANSQVREEERTELIDDLQDVYEGESEKKDAEIGRLIKKIAANHIASGITELNPLIDATLADVADIIPEMTWEDVLNTFADYGRYRPLDKNALKTAIRDKRRQALQLSKLLALYKKQPLQKTGLERGTPSDTERELIKLVNEAKKEFGIETTDPETQLKSALDAVKTRLRNEIYDLEKQITTREKMIRERAPLKYDKEAIRLKAIRDRLKATYDQIFADPQADAAKKLAMATANAEKSLAYYTDLLRRKSIATKPKNIGPTTPELERIRQRRNMIRREVIKLRNAAKPKKSIEERVLERYAKREAEYKRRMAAGDYAPRPRKAPFMSQRTLTAAANVERVKREFDEWAYDEIMKNKPFAEKAVSFMANIGNVLKSIQYGGEVSSIGRQLFLGWPVEWAVYADAVKDTLRAWKDPNYAKEVEAFVETHPLFRAANVWANIQFTTAGIPGKNEFLPSKLPEKLPVIGQLYRRGDAAFNAPLNKQRLGLFDVLTKQYVQEGKLTSDFYMSPTAEDVRVMKRLGGWINDLTGRSAVGKSNAMRQAFTFLNYVGGAPRYTLAKLKLTASGFGVLRSVLPGIERTKDANGKERIRLVGNFDRILLGRSAKALMKFAAFNIMVATAAYLVNPDDNEFIFDPRSSDFMKVRVGNQRYDFTVGIGAILRLFTQLATGERRDAAGRIQEADRKYLLEQYIKSKESPLLRMVMMLYTGEDFVGQPISKTKAVTDSLLMLFLNDAWDSYKNSGLLASLTALVAGAFGVGVQSYPETASTSVKKTQDELAQAAYGKNWMDLSDIQQRDLRRGSVILKDLELKKQQERQLEPYEYKQDAKEFEAGQRIFKSLSSENQKKLLDLGIKSINIGRSIGLDGFILNDARFKAYEDEVIRVFKGQDFKSLTQKGVENRINTAREIARRNILQKIRQGQL